MKLTLTALVVLLVLAVPGTGPVSAVDLRVGPLGQAGCNHGSILAAINAIGSKRKNGGKNGVTH